MLSKGGLFSHLTCFVYAPYLQKLRDLKITKLAKVNLVKNIFSNKQANYTLFVQESFLLS